jgi:tetratricopeptide (TPR) repeat protein
MAYVRRKGNQLAIVHGERDLVTSKVEQRVLFTLYSKAEALEAIGRGSGTEQGTYRFQSLLENEYPSIRINWDKIRQGIEDNMSHLPDLYQYRPARLMGQFRKDLLCFARQLILTDPQDLESSARVIATHRYELEFLNELIRWRLDHSDQEKSEWNADNPFYWRFSLRGREVPPETEETAVDYFERGEHQKAEAIFRMLVEAFDDYAEGHNYLGLIALDQDRLDEAIGHFRKTMEVGRRLFPKRLAKKHYWRQLATRPYMRGLRNLALTLNRAGEYIEALDACEKLERECGDNATAAWHRAAIYLNTGRWEMALESSESLVRGLSPDAGFIAGFAAIELGERERAIDLFLHGALHNPRTARMLAGIRTGKPTNRHEAEGHNAGVYWRQNIHGYLAKRRSNAKRFFRQFVEHPAVISLLNEMDAVTGRWHEQHRGGGREDFDRLNEMKSTSFIKAQAHQIVVALQV